MLRQAQVVVTVRYSTRFRFSAIRTRNDADDR